MKNKYNLLIAILLSILIIIVCTAFGSADIKITNAFKILLFKIFSVKRGLTPNERIILNVRLPRVLLAFFSGGFLSVCGCISQSIFKNPLADPYLLGTSSSAAFGATIGIVLGISYSFLGISSISFLAFLFSMFSMLIVFNLAGKGFCYSKTGLLLAGIIIGQIFSSLTNLVMMLCQSQMKQIIFWTFGSFSAKSWRHFFIVVPLGSVLCTLTYKFSKALDLSSLSDDEALSLGCDIKKMRKILLMLNCLLTSIVVSVSGIIGFIGLISPHIARKISSATHKKLLPASFFIGANSLAICDTIAKSITSSEIPIGIITALLGAPFFLVLFLKLRKV